MSEANLNDISSISCLDIQESKAANLILPKPFQIPPPPRDFVGREIEIQGILSDIKKGETTISLRGMAGIGKTALAFILADKIKSQFPDGQIFIDMKGTSKEPLSSYDAMAHVVRSYLGIDILPKDIGGLKGLYFSILSGKKALILLDNVMGREQIEPILPPKGSALLITSRKKFAFPGLRATDLEVLSFDDAIRLIQSITGRKDEQDSELARLCGFLPLALVNAASALKERPDMAMMEYIAKLTDCRKRLGLIETSFSLSYELLDQTQQKLWCLLSIFPADFDIAAASAVWDEKKAAAEDALGSLVMMSLVNSFPAPSGESYRYLLHDLARDFAGSRLDETELVKARLKYAIYYKDLLSYANKLFLQGGKSMQEALELFSKEWVNIQAGQSWSEKNKDRDPEALALCSSYFNAGSNLLNLRLHPNDLIKWLEAALIAARNKSDRQSEATYLGYLGQAYFHLGETNKAVEYYDNAWHISHEIGDKRGEAFHLGNIGMVSLKNKNYDEAIEYNRQALDMSRELGDKRSEAIHLGNIGLSYSYKGDFKEAKESNEKALAISREIGDRLGEANYQGNIGQAYLNNGNFPEAVGYFEAALTISREIGDIRSEAKHLANIGIANSNMNNISKAMDYYNQALAISKQIGDKTTEKAVNDSINFKKDEEKILIASTIKT